MAQGKRNRLSTEQRIDMWRRWKAGESLHDIGRAFGKGHGSIRFLLTQRGGIVPAARRRSLRTLTLAEREDISRGIASGSSIREIAHGLQRAVSTVSREVVRHGGRLLYRANEADRQAWNSALRPKVCLLAIEEKLRTIVASKLILDWSPEQISAWLKVHDPTHVHRLRPCIGNLIGQAIAVTLVQRQLKGIIVAGSYAAAIKRWSDVSVQRARLRVSRPWRQSSIVVTANRKAGRYGADIVRCYGRGLTEQALHAEVPLVRHRVLFMRVIEKSHLVEGCGCRKEAAGSASEWVLGLSGWRRQSRSRLV